MADKAFTPHVRQGFDPQILDVIDLPSEVGLVDGLLRELVDQLGGQEREVVEGLFWEGVSKRELARRMQVSRQKVNTLLARGMRQIREALSVPSR